MINIAKIINKLAQLNRLTFDSTLTALLMAATYASSAHALGPQDFSQPDYEGVISKERSQKEAAKREASQEREKRELAERKAREQEAIARYQESKIRQLESKLKALAVAPAVKAEAGPDAGEALQVKNEPKSGLTVGTIFRDRLKGGDKGPELVAIPPGRYWRGAADGEAGAGGDEKPQKEVRIDYRFALGRYEVTVGEYLACVSDGGCKEPEWRERGNQNHYQTGSSILASVYKKFGRVLTDDPYPIVGVSWHDAQAYVTWLSGKSGLQYRLPSELEWEYAARGDIRGTKASQTYPWGKSDSHEFANYGEDSCCNSEIAGRDQWHLTSPEGSFPDNGFKLHDMHGNVWEWVEDCYYDSYGNANIQASGRPEDGGAATGCDSNPNRVMRGGSFIGGLQEIRSANRRGTSSLSKSAHLGFRVARTLP